MLIVVAVAVMAAISNTAIVMMLLFINLIVLSLLDVASMRHLFDKYD